MEMLWGRDAFVEALKGSRQQLYSTIASVAGSLLGFILTAVSIVLVLSPSPRFRILRESGQLERAYRVYFQAILWLAASTVLSFVALLLDTDRSPKPVL